MKAKGFTFVESALFIALAAILITTTNKIVLLAIEGKDVQMLAEGLQRDVSEACFRFSREIRGVRGATDLTVADVTEVRFVDSSSADIRYRLNGTDLLRNDQVLVEDVSALVFIYYDSSGSAVASPAVSPATTSVRSVQMLVTVQSQGSTFSLQAEAKLRNLL